MKKLHYLKPKAEIVPLRGEDAIRTSGRDGTDITQGQDESTVRDFFKSTVGE